MLGTSVLLLGVSLSAVVQPAPSDSLTLEKALELARRQSPVLAAAGAAVQEADARGSGARARRAPGLSVDGAYLRWQGAPEVGLGTLGAYAPYADDNFLFQLGLVQPLYTGGRVAAGVRAADRGREAAKLTAAFAEVELTAGVAGAHNDALFGRARLEVARQAVRVLEEAMRVAREQYGSGTVARLDVLRAETRLSAVRAELRAAESAVRGAEERLAALVGLDVAEAPPVAGELEYMPLSPEGVRLEAPVLAGRPDLEALGARAAVAEALASAARAERLPSVSLFATALTSRPELVTGRTEWGLDVLGG